jgi:hypothetical protein
VTEVPCDLCNSPSVDEWVLIHGTQVYSFCCPSCIELWVRLKQRGPDVKFSDETFAEFISAIHA